VSIAVKFHSTPSLIIFSVTFNHPVDTQFKELVTALQCCMLVDRRPLRRRIDGLWRR
jgi:hypothetical protein